MFWLTFITFVDLFVTIFNLLLIARVLGSYILRPSGRLYVGLVELTEPMLVPVRRLLPKTPGVDWAPLVTFFLLQGLQILVHWAFGA